MQFSVMVIGRSNYAKGVHLLAVKAAKKAYVSGQNAHIEVEGLCHRRSVKQLKID